MCPLSHVSNAGRHSMPQYDFGTPPQSTTELFAQLCHRFDESAPTLGDVAHFAGPRTYALILLIFALPEALPLPVAGVSTILAIPLILVSLLMLLHGPEPRLPVWLSERRVPLRLLKIGSTRIGQALNRLERVSRPRWPGLIGQTRVIGAVCLVLAVVIALPIPFGNMLPALCILGIAVGMLQRDGALVAGSMTAGGLVVTGLSTVIALAGDAVFAIVREVLV
jgi:hypothetical protein